jgi:hypothetical protein
MALLSIANPEPRDASHGVHHCTGNSPGKVHPERTYRVALGGRFASRLRLLVAILMYWL